MLLLLVILFRMTRGYQGWYHQWQITIEGILDVNGCDWWSSDYAGFISDDQAKYLHGDNDDDNDDENDDDNDDDNDENDENVTIEGAAAGSCPVVGGWHAVVI